MTETDDLDLPTELRSWMPTGRALTVAERFHAHQIGLLSATRLEAQSRALTASQEAIDTLQERVAELEEALEAIARGDDSLDGMAGDIARAALNAKRPAE